jgi:hypothetical protein
MLESYGWRKGRNKEEGQRKKEMLSQQPSSTAEIR